MKFTLSSVTMILCCLTGLLQWQSCRSCNCSEVSMCGDGPEATSFGEFIFTHQATTDTEGKNGISVRLDFRPDNSSDPNITCPDSVGFIQIVRTVSLRDPNRFYYPTSQKARRATTDGWYIDRPDGLSSPIYGRKDRTDNGNFTSKIRQLGVLTATQSQMASMTDSPYRYEYPHLRGILWQGITVAVCIDDGPCYGTQLGYYCWSWSVTEDGQVVDVRHGPGRATLESQITKAQEKWNAETMWGTTACPELITQVN